MEGTSEKKGLFERNEEEVCNTICKILLWATMVFPALFLLSAAHVFRVTFRELVPISILGVICTISPTILLKCKAPITLIKNYSIVALAIMIALMASNSHLGIYMTYVLALALSCMYFDKKFTIRTAVIGYLCLVAGVFFRSGNVTLMEGETRMKWFTAYTMGYTIEYIAMSAVFIALAKRARRLLENLHSTEKVEELLESCGAASKSLSDLLGNLKQTIHETADNNQKIQFDASRTKEGCESNLSQVQETRDSILNMDENMQMIHRQTEEMSRISADSYEKTMNYIDIMNQAVGSMHSIESSSDEIREKITQVGACSEEIASFADMIVGIANQTNILAINASIEAARAGEQGKGFTVVATQVKVLAERCKEATQSITAQIQKMNENVEAAHASVNENGRIVSDGIREIMTAQEEARKLLDVQTVSGQKVKEVEENLAASLKHQERVAEMAEEMSDTTKHSREQVENIGVAIEQQAELAESMERAFEEVRKISDTLLQISQQK